MARKKKPPLRADATESADQAERAALISDTAPLSAGLIDERLAQNDDDYRGDPNLKLAEWERDKAYEEAFNAVATEISRRAALLGDAYPFKVSGSHLEYKASDTGLYEYLLCLSLVDSYSKGKKAIATRAFEAVACAIAESYLGEDAASYRMGWPPAHGSPVKFKDRVDELRTKSGNFAGEWVWGPKELNPQDPSHTFIKEQGLDIIAWKNSVDARAGQLYLLGQCACGKNWDSDVKLQDLSLKLLAEWISEVSCVEPVRAIFTPRHALTNSLPFLSRHGGLVFDRVRITLLGQRKQAIAAIAKRPRALRRLTKVCLS
jgi:hypothetical protein